MRRRPTVSVSTSGASVVVIRRVRARGERTGALRGRVAIDVMWHRPATPATPARWNAQQRIQLIPRLTSALPRLTQQANEYLCGGEGIAPGSVPRCVLHAIEARQMIERAPRELRHEASRHLHRAEAPPFHALTGGTRDLCRDEAPIEARVMRHEDVPA